MAPAACRRLPCGAPGDVAGCAAALRGALPASAGRRHTSSSLVHEPAVPVFTHSMCGPAGHAARQWHMPPPGSTGTEPIPRGTGGRRLATCACGCKAGCCAAHLCKTCPVQALTALVFVRTSPCCPLTCPAFSHSTAAALHPHPRPIAPLTWHRHSTTPRAPLVRVPAVPPAPQLRMTGQRSRASRVYGPLVARVMLLIADGAPHQYCR